MILLKKLLLFACVMAALSCGEREDMLDFATTGDGAAGKNVYIFATYPSAPPYNVYLVIANEKEQVCESLLGSNMTETFNNFHVSEDGIAYMCFTSTIYECLRPYQPEWIVSANPLPGATVRFASNYMMQGAIANALLYRFPGAWVNVGSFSNPSNIMAADYSPEEKRIYTVDSGGNLQRYSTEDMTFESVYLPVYTPAIGVGVLYLHRGSKHMYVGMTSRFYFCDKPAFNTSDQFNRLGSDIADLPSFQNANNYCVTSDESMIFASTAESGAPFTMHLYLRNGGSWSRILSFPAAASGERIRLFDLAEGKLVLWVDSASALGGIYVFDYKNYELNRVSINPLFTIQAAVVK